LAVLAGFPDVYKGQELNILTVEGLFHLVILGDDEGSAVLAIFDKWQLVGVCLGLYEEVDGSWVSVVRGVVEWGPCAVVERVDVRASA
jgi:hypothetical protein